MQGLDTQTISSEQYRLLYKPKEKQSCYICGKYKPVCEAHHVLKVSRAIEIINQYEYQGEITIRIVWLCPTHHALYHKFGSGLRGQKLFEVVDCFSREEYDLLGEIITMARADESNLLYTIIESLRVK